MMLKLALITWLALLVLVVGSYRLVLGKDITSYKCAPSANLIDDATLYTVATREQLRFLQALFIVQQSNPDDLPPGDSALMKHDGENVHVIFVDGDQACAVMLVYKPGVVILDQIGRGEINHVGKGL